MDKRTLVSLAKEHGLRPKKPRDPKFNRLKDIRNNPREVLVQDVKTGEIRTFPSIYRASKFIGCDSKTVCNWSGRVWKDKYRIRV